ncbi:MAG: hypothetical protein LBT39_03855, partial [Treponema sp.]|nr:hypothetical protein [Treponema sp.]
ELSAEHKWTPDEEAQLAQGILKEQKANGLRYAVEVSHIITRTYHGTALAIKYKDGLNYYEAEELRVNTPIAPVPTR